MRRTRLFSIVIITGWAWSQVASAAPACRLTDKYLTQGEELQVAFSGAASLQSASVTIRSTTGDPIWAREYELLGQDETIVPIWRPSANLMDGDYMCTVTAQGLESELRFLLIGRLQAEAIESIENLEASIAESDIALTTKVWPGKFSALYRSVQRLTRNPVTTRVLGPTGSAVVDRYVSLTRRGKRLASEMGFRRRVPAPEESVEASTALRLEGTVYHFTGPWLSRTTPVDDEDIDTLLDPSFVPERWVPIELPAELHTALTAQRMISNPLVRGNDRATQWVKDRAWWFRKSIRISARAAIKSPKIDLIVEDARGTVDVWLNGKPLASTAPGVFTVPTEAMQERTALFVLRYIPESTSKAAEGGGLFQSLGRRTTLFEKDDRADRTLESVLDRVGILGGIHLRASGRHDLVSFDYSTSLNPDGPGGEYRVRMEIDNWTDKEVSARMRLSSGFESLTSSTVRPVTLAVGRTVLTATAGIKMATHWYPVGGPEEPASLMGSIRLTFDRQSMIFERVDLGLRSVELGADPQGRQTILVGGHPYLVRGAKWYGIDALGYAPSEKVGTDRLERLLDLAAAGHMNTLWCVTGALEPEGFYAGCAKRGIMVWQRLNPPETAWSDLEGWVTRILQDVRGTPCVVAWETDPSLPSAQRQQLKEALSKLDPVRLVDVHPWTEIGDTQKTMPSWATVRMLLGSSAAWPPEDSWLHHGADEEFLRRVAAMPGGASATLMTQESQTYDLSDRLAAMDDKGPTNTGIMFGRFNDPWPTFSDSLVDYFGRPKRAYYEMKRRLRPLRVVWRGDGPYEVWIENRSATNYDGIFSSAVGAIDNPLGRMFHRAGARQSFKVTIPPWEDRSVVTLEAADVGQVTPEVSYMFARFSIAGKIQDFKFRFFAPREERLPAPRVTARIIDTTIPDSPRRVLKILSRGFIETVTIADDNTLVLLDDNYFDLAFRLSYEVKYSLSPALPQIPNLKIFSKNLGPKDFIRTRFGPSTRGSRR